jgi:hypothetical protein
MEAQPPANTVVALPLASAAAITQADLQTLYDTVAAGLKQILANKPTNIATLALDLKPIIVAIVKTVEDYSNNKSPPLDSVTKQGLALNLMKYAMQQLNAQGLIPNDLYANLTAVADFVGPTIIDGCVAVFQKAQAVESDIAAHGCKGCCARNCTML